MDRLVRCSERYALKLGVRKDPGGYSDMIHQCSGQPIGSTGLHGYRHAAPFSRRGHVLQLWGFGLGDNYRLYI